MKILKSKITETNLEGYPNAINEQHYIPLIFSVTLYIEPRCTEGKEWKTFVYIKVFGITIMHWHYRDTYIRERYIASFPTIKD